MIGAIAMVVAIAIVLSYSTGRTFGLPRKMAILIACGNSICGNCAIAAVAPVIDADADDVAASMSFTVVLGVVVVLVPQVLAATGAVSLSSVHIGTLVKDPMS